MRPLLLSASNGRPSVAFLLFSFFFVNDNRDVSLQGISQQSPVSGLQPSEQDAYESCMTVSCKNPFILSVPNDCMNRQMQKEKEVVPDCSSTTNLENSLAKQEHESPLNQGGKHNLGLRGKISPQPLIWRTPQTVRRSCNASFKSPVLPPPRSCPPADKDILQHEIEELKRKELAVDQEIAQIKTEGYSLEELENHITLLHEYNEIKDTGQMLLGRLAAIRGVTTKDLYPEFDLDLND
ncbi:DNA repair protein SWI5 homolog [Notechis scutatus]|uniref:DNA repair protein SWI5 homolog n=1 Tax=Notechis scutatus TaxID=8663 RepID=A0A6J1VQK3_9SAUR|nr:DNA repair protein SWI5 homolog [Notechis scutatus]